MTEQQQYDVKSVPSQLDEQIKQALSNDTIPEIHFNGFINALGQGDTLLILTRHGQPVARLTASYIVTKTLAKKLAEMIVSLEQEMGNVIMTTDEIIAVAQKRESQ